MKTRWVSLLEEGVRRGKKEEDDISTSNY